MPRTTAATTNAPSIDDMASSFDLHLAGEQKSIKTRRIYGNAVRYLEAYFREQGMPTLVGNVRREHVEAFMASLPDRGWKPATSNQVHRSLVQFWKFVRAEGEVRQSPMEALRAPRIPETERATVRADDFLQILKGIRGETFAAKRDRAILSLLFDSGVRRAEIAGLQLSDLDLRNGQMVVTGKAGHERVVPFGARTATALDRYIRERTRWTGTRGRQRYGRETALWLGEQGPMGVWGIAQVVERRAKAVGLTGISAHAFRRGFATVLLGKGMDAGLLMRLAGWKGRAMVDLYTRAAAVELALADYKARSPVDRADD